MTRERIDTILYGKRYYIAVCKENDKFTYTVRLGENGTGKAVKEFTYDSKAEGDRQIQEDIANLDKERISLRKDNVPTVSEFVEAFSTVQITDNQLDMLKFHAQANDRVATAGELAKAVNYTDLGAANLQYGNLAKAIGEFLNYNPKERRNGKPIPTFIIAKNANDDEGTKNEDITNWRWKLRNEVYQAMKIVGLIN